MIKKWLVLGIALAIVLFFYWDLGHYLTLDMLKKTHHHWVARHAESPWWVATIFFVLCVGVTTFSLPGNTLLMLAGGALFGLGIGTLLVSFSFSLGATLAFLLARHLFRAPIQHHFAHRLAQINQGLATEGVIYLLTLRLLPVIPSSLVNLLMGLTTIPVRTFYWVTQLGTLAATLIYVQAGTQLAQLQHPSDALPLTLLCTLLLVALLPLLVKKVVEKRGIYRKNNP